MTLPSPPTNPFLPIPNGPFYFPPRYNISTPQGYLNVGAGLTVDGSSLNVTGGGGAGGVSQVTAGVGIATTPAAGITSTGSIGLAPTGLAANTYDYVRRISVDAYGRINAAPVLYTSPPIVRGEYTAKGTILAASGPGVPVQVAVGANGTVLTADSTSATGVRWESPNPGGVETIIGQLPITVTGGTSSTATISIAIATASNLGVAQAGLHLVANNGIFNVVEAAPGQAGVVQVGDNINLVGSTISVADSAIGVQGVVSLTDQLDLDDDTVALAASAGKNLQDQIDSLVISGGLTLAGTFNCNVGVISSVTSAGTAAGFTAGTDLPSPIPAINGFFVIVDTAGTYTPPGSSFDNDFFPGDWILCDGTQWVLIPIGSSTLPVATTTTQGVTRLATEAETQQGTSSAIAVTPAGIASLVATTSSNGLVQLATQQEVTDGVNTSAVVTPSTLQGKLASQTRLGLTRYATQIQVAAGEEAALAVSPQTLLGLQATSAQKGLVYLLDDINDPSTSETAITARWFQDSLNGELASYYDAPGTILQASTVVGAGPTSLPVGTSGQILQVNSSGNQLEYTGVVDGGTY